MRDLTDKQTMILHYLAEQIHTIGYPPSLREIGEKFNISSLRGVTVHLDALERKGYLTRGHKARQIALTPTGKDVTGCEASARPHPEAAPVRPGVYTGSTDRQTAAAIITRIRAEAREWQPGGITAKVLNKLADKFHADYLEAA